MVKETLHKTAPSQDDQFATVVIAQVEQEIAALRKAFAEGDVEMRKKLIEGRHSIDRFENLDPHADTLSDHDARLLLANKRGYATWRKYNDYLHLDPNVRKVIEAIHTNDLERLQNLLEQDASAGNPHYVPGYDPSDSGLRSYSNDSIPLFEVSNCIFDGQIPVGTNEYAMAKALIDAGADPEIDHGHPMTGGVSYNAINVVRALLDSGATADGPYGHGCPMAFAMHFGFTDIAQLLSERGAKLDLRFAAGLGDLEQVKSFINPDGSLKAEAGILADPYTRSEGPGDESRYRMERTRENILLQALYFACRNGHLDVAEFLSGQDMSINAIVPGLDLDVTTLHWCSWLGAQWGATGSTQPAEQRCYNAVRFLLEHGADPNIWVENGGKPMDWVSTDEIKALLREYGAK